MCRETQAVITEDTLHSVAAIAVTLIGFSGVVTALGPRGEGRWSASELLQLRTLVEPSIVSLAGAFLPIALGQLVSELDTVWRISNGLLACGHTIGVSLFLTRGATAEVLLSHKILTVVTFAILAAMLGSAFDFWPWYEFTFLFGLLLGIAVSLNNFYLLLFVEKQGAA